MKVAVVTNKLINGGGERVLEKSIPELLNNGILPTVVFIGAAKNLDRQICARIEHAGATIATGRSAIKNLLQSDIIHLYNLNVFVKLLPLLLLNRLPPAICHIHGSATTANSLSRKLFLRYRHHLANRIYVSKASRESYRDPEADVISNPVELASNPQQKLASSADPLRLVSVNRLETVKNLPRQLRALAEINDARSATCTLDVFGQGSQWSELHKLAASLNIEDLVTFHGSVANSELLAFMPNFDIFISTSNAEGFGIALVEALSANLKCVVTRIPAYVEIENEVGSISFLPNEAKESPEADADHILKAMSPDAPKNASLETLEALYGVQRFVDSLKGVYRRAAR